MTNNVQVPGGYYLSTDGKSAHDANGNLVPLLGSHDTVEPKDQAVASVALPAEILPETEGVVLPDPASPVVGTVEETKSKEKTSKKKAE